MDLMYGMEIKLSALVALVLLVIALYAFDKLVKWIDSRNETN